MEIENWKTEIKYLAHCVIFYSQRISQQKESSKHTDFDSFSDMKIENCMCRLVTK